MRKFERLNHESNHPRKFRCKSFDRTRACADRARGKPLARSGNIVRPSRRGGAAVEPCRLADGMVGCRSARTRQVHRRRQSARFRKRALDVYQRAAQFPRLSAAGHRVGRDAWNRRGRAHRPVSLDAQGDRDRDAVVAAHAGRCVYRCECECGGGLRLCRAASACGGRVCHGRAFAGGGDRGGDLRHCRRIQRQCCDHEP